MSAKFFICYRKCKKKSPFLTKLKSIVNYIYNSDAGDAA